MKTNDLQRIADSLEEICDLLRGDTPCVLMDIAVAIENLKKAEKDD